MPHQVTISVTQISGGYRAKGGGFTSTSTSGPNWAAAACAAKVLGCKADEVVYAPEEPVRNNSGYPVYPCGKYICARPSK